jgi:hypothetical protein
MIDQWATRDQQDRYYFEKGEYEGAAANFEVSPHLIHFIRRNTLHAGEHSR